MLGRVTLLLVVAHAGCVHRSASVARAPDHAVHLRVSLDRRLGPARPLTGFLHGFTASIATAIYEPLRPGLFRRGNRFPEDRDDPEYQVYQRVLAAGATYEYVLSDGWGYDKPWTLANAASWAVHVFRTVSTARELGMHVSFDVWNEPNDPSFWSGTRAELMSAFWIAFVAAKLADPSAVIGGPSLSWFDEHFISEWLDLCVAHGLQPRFLSWHETDSHDAPDAVIVHAQRARQLLRAHAPLTVSELEINEWGARATSFSPGISILYFHHLERAGITRAAHASWDARWRLGGLLVEDGDAPRAVYWAWRGYADGQGARVETESSEPRIAAVATADQANGRHRIHVIVGSGATSMTDVAVTFDGVEAGRFELAVARIPPTHHAQPRPPRELPQPPVAVEHGAATLVVHDVLPDEAFVIVGEFFPTSSSGSMVRPSRGHGAGAL